MSYITALPLPYVFALNTFVCMTLVSAVLARRPQASWLLDFIVLLGLVLITQLARAAVYDPNVTNPPPNLTVDVIDLVGSAISTGLLAWLGLRLLERGSLGAQAGITIAALIQFIANVVLLARQMNWEILSKLTSIDSVVLKVADSGTCVLAGLIYSVGVARHFNNRYMSMMTVASGSVWCLGCALYWIDFPADSPEKIIVRSLLIGGVASVSIFTALLGLRQPPGGKMPNVVLPLHPQQAQ